ncbi:MAG: CBS domain-containing protein [Omnitrophica bacterium]|nr:CBS domain-containing protein [Candidatus Omnitrophota bacterium]
MKVIEATVTDIITVKRSSSLRSVLNKFKNFHIHPLIPVVDDQNCLIGIVYPENLLDLLRPQHAKLFRNIPFLDIDEDTFDLDSVPLMGELIIVDDIMTTNFITIMADDSLQEAYKSMRLHKKEQLAVVDSEGKIVGTLGIFDIIWKMFKEKEIV